MINSSFDIPRFTLETILDYRMKSKELYDQFRTVDKRQELCEEGSAHQAEAARIKSPSLSRIVVQQCLNEAWGSAD